MILFIFRNIWKYCLPFYGHIIFLFKKIYKINNRKIKCVLLLRCLTSYSSIATSLKWFFFWQEQLFPYLILNPYENYLKKCTSSLQWFPFIETLYNTQTWSILTHFSLLASQSQKPSSFLSYFCSLLLFVFVLYSDSWNGEDPWRKFFKEED